MRHIRARLLVVLSALALALPMAANATVPTSVDEGGGGSGSGPSYTFIVRVYTTDANGNVYWWNCEYLDFGNGWVIQTRCW